MRYFILEGGVGTGTGALDVGAPTATDVYAPVDGTVIAIMDHHRRTVRPTARRSTSSRRERLDLVVSAREPAAPIPG